MANAFPPVSSGIDHDGRSLGAANPVSIRRSSRKSSREEIARRIAAAREAEER